MMRRSSGIKNRTIFIADNLHIMRGMPDESVDLIYLDPPFNKKKNFSAPIGSEAAGAEFKDAWTLSDVDEVWWGEIANKNEALYTVLDAINKTAGEDLMSYSIYMAIRLLEMHRILKGTGSLYLHCDPGPDCQPLPQDGAGHDIWQATFPQGDNLVTGNRIWIQISSERVGSWT